MLNLLTFPWTSDHNQHWLSRMLGKSTGNPEQRIGCYALGVCADRVATTLEGCLPNNPISGLEARQLADRLTRLSLNACKLNCLDWEDFLLGGSILIAGSR